MRAVSLYGAKAAGRHALVDDQDYGLVMQYRWNVQECSRGGPYARAHTPGGGYVFMHTLIAGYLWTDHKDGNGLNNQRTNLRPATVVQNNRNRRKRAGTTSRYTGVNWNPLRRKWQARIGIDGTQRSLGYFTSEVEAALAYDAAALRLFGEYARPNFPGAVQSEGAAHVQ